MTNLSRSFGVDYSIVQNLTGKRRFLSWFPANSGEGRWIEAREQIRFSGNIFEVVSGVPKQKAALNLDIINGDISIATCGASPDKYDVVETQSVFINCNVPVWDSSSSTIVI